MIPKAPNYDDAASLAARINDYTSSGLSAAFADCAEAHAFLVDFVNHCRARDVADEERKRAERKRLDAEVIERARELGELRATREELKRTRRSERRLDKALRKYRTSWRLHKRAAVEDPVERLDTLERAITDLAEEVRKMKRKDTK